MSIGPEAERSLGWRHFVELTGIVSSDPEIVVRYGQTEVGRVHPLSFRRDGEDYAPILLGGRSWRITSIDWRRRIAHAARNTAHLENIHKVAVISDFNPELDRLQVEVLKGEMVEEHVLGEQLVARSLA